jgi:hypothetical protein
MVAGYWRQGIADWEMAAGNRRQGEAARKWQQGSAKGKWWKRKVDAESGKMEVMVKNRCREFKE